MDEDGYVYVVDRLKDMILTAGYNVYPAEIERVVMKHPAAVMASVGAVPDEVKGDIDVSSIRQLLISSAPGTKELKTEIMAFFKNAELWEAYGCTEGGLATLLRPEDQFEEIIVAGLSVQLYTQRPGHRGRVILS